MAHWFIGSLIFLLPSLYGEGYEAINKSLQGDISYLYESTFYQHLADHYYVIILLFLAVIFLKTVATTMTFIAGGIGGIFAPSLFIGANLGLLLAYVCNLFHIPLNMGNFALVGMSGVFAGILHAPMTAIFLIAETTGGHGLFMPLMITSTISYATVRIFKKNSVYTYLLAKRGELMTHDKDKQVLLLMNIQSIIETQFIKVHPKGKLRDLIQAISESNRNIFPVVQDGKYYVGFISRAKFFSAYRKLLAEHSED